MKIIKETSKYHKFAFEFPFDMGVLEFCRYVKGIAGWQHFNFSEGKWRFSNTNIIDIIKNKYPDIEIDEEAISEIKREKLAEIEKEMIAERAEELKTKQDSDIKIKGIKSDLYPYQRVGVEFFINNKGRAILADTMGLGKTVQALAYVVHEGLKKTLVVCPSSVKYSWENEVKKWTKLKSLVIDSKSNMDINEFNDYDIFIINYDILKKFYNVLSVLNFNCMIMDEFHYIKNNSAQRTKIAKSLALNIPSVLLLSGTPLLSRPAELFNGLQIMDKKEWPDWYTYTQKYCNGHQGYWGYDYSGSSNIEELQQRISRYFLRRRKEEVLKELPPKTLINVPVKLSDDKQEEYNMALDDIEGYLFTYKDKDVEEIEKSKKAKELVRLNALRQITSNGKIESAKDVIRNIIDGGEKVVVFSVYNDPLLELQREFKKESVMITGSIKEEERRKAIDDFQNDPKKKVFLGGMKSAGVGITLTAAQNVVFIDYSWVPADHHQAADRIHRIGQEASVIYIYQLYTKGTIDEKMMKILEEKQLLFSKLIDEPAMIESQNSIINDLLKEMQRENKKNKSNKKKNETKKG